MVLHNWKREFAAHSKINPRDIVVLDQPGKKRLNTFLDAVNNQGSLTQPKIIITNFEAMQMKALVDCIEEWRPEILVCDESHRLKNPKSKRAKKVLQIAKLVKHTYILTGTPILNTSADIFMQYLILDKGKTFGDNFYVFQNKYLQNSNAGWSGKPGNFPKWEERAEMYGELHDKIYSKAIRKTKEECMDLPPLIKQRVDVPLGKVQAKHYKEMKNDFITFIQDSLAKDEMPKAVIAQMALTKAIRLQQISSGYCKAEDGTEIEIKENPRLDILADLLLQLTGDHKVIIWAVFKNNYKQIGKLLRKLNLEYREIHGDVSTKEKNRSMEIFQNDPKCRVVICNAASAGLGINLTQASYSIFYSRGFSLGNDVQAESRNHRGGSEIHEKITRIDLVARDTIDELVAESLANKQQIADQILEWGSRL